MKRFLVNRNRSKNHALSEALSRKLLQAKDLILLGPAREQSNAEELQDPLHSLE